MGRKQRRIKKEEDEEEDKKVKKEEKKVTTKKRKAKELVEIDDDDSDFDDDAYEAEMEKQEQQPKDPRFNENIKTDVYKQAKIPEDIDNLWYPIYSPEMDSYQMDLTFHNIGTTEKEYVQGILSLININTRYAVAIPLTYYCKNTEEGRKKISKETITVLNGFIKALIYMIHFKERKVRRIFTDEGGEFTNSVIHRFCEDPMEFIRTDKRALYRQNYIPQWGMSLYKGIKPIKHLKKRPSSGTDFGKMMGFTIPPIELINLKKKEGSKRRLAIVERFNGTIKMKFQDVAAIDNDVRESQYGKKTTLVADKYNHTPHRGLREILEDIPKLKHRAENITPKGVNRSMERKIIKYMEKETRRVDRNLDEPYRRIRIGDRVRYMITDPKDVQKAVKYKNVFGKETYGWSRGVFTVVRKQKRTEHPDSKDARTFYLAGEDGEELPRRFLAWELRIIEKNKKVKKDEGNLLHDAEEEIEALDKLNWKKVKK